MLKVIKITLRKEDGTNKTYSTDFISGKMLRRAMEIRQDLAELGEKPEGLDEVYAYFADAFGGQFTAEEFEDGIDSRVMTDTIAKYLTAITSKTAEAIGASDESDPN